MSSKKSFAILALALSNLACSSSGMVDFAMGSAKSPTSHRALVVGDRAVLAGDMHCHVLPPDSRWHVSRELPETIARAKKEDLDFVVLTPHVPARFFLDSDERAWVLRTQRELRASIAAADVGGVVVIPGFEYTDRRYGHVGAGFADVEAVLASLTIDEAHARPEAFFERWLAAGGSVVINHPVERPLPHAPFSPLRHDLSWRAFSVSPPPVPSEIAFITTHALGVETFNASITHLRDQFILGDEERSLREASMLVDRAAREQRRRIAHVGGSDSHGSWLRPTTYVLAKEKSASAIHAAIAEARTCVRGPEACTFELRTSGEGAWASVGDAIATTKGSTLEARASAGDLVVLVNGVAVARAAKGAVARVEVPTDRCTMVRAMVGPLSWSSPIYVGCGF